MPRRFTPREEERIRDDLRTAGRSIIGARGVRKTSIDELVRAAGISKGSFYRFYSSKESLALELLAEWEREFHESIEKRFLERRPRGIAETAEVLSTVMLDDFPRHINDSGLQGLFAQEEIAHLTRAVGEDEARVMDEQDFRLFTRLRPHFRSAGLVPTTEEAVMIAGLRMIFDTGLGLLEGASIPGDGSDSSGEAGASAHARGASARVHDASARVHDASGPARDASAPARGTLPVDRGTAPRDRGTTLPPDRGAPPSDAPTGLRQQDFQRAFGLLMEGFLARVFFTADTEMNS
jgi:AcrR family transcriptional regulator